MSSESMASNTAVEPVQLSWEDAVAQLQGPDLSLRYYAAWYLGTIRDPRSVDPLVQALEDDDDRTALGGYPLRRNAAKALGSIGDARAVPGLIKALRCSDTHVQEEAAYALGQIGDPQALDALATLLQDPTAIHPWEAIISAIGQLDGQKYAERIQPFLTDPSKRVQAAAAWVLYRFTQDPALTTTLVSLMRQEESMLGQAVLSALARSGWLGGAETIAKAKLAVNLRLNALKLLFDSAVTLPDVTPEVAAATVMPWIETLL